MWGLTEHPTTLAGDWFDPACEELYRDAVVTMLVHDGYPIV
jgi:hypothetical protein